MPVSVALVHKIQMVTEINCEDLSSPVPLLRLITQHTSQGKLDTKGLYVVSNTQDIGGHRDSLWQPELTCASTESHHTTYISGKAGHYGAVCVEYYTVFRW